MSIIFPEDKSRFMVTGPFDDEMPYYYVLITDFKWWVANETEIHAWMRACLPDGEQQHQGMVVTINDEADLSNFLLRWAG